MSNRMKRWHGLMMGVVLVSATTAAAQVTSDQPAAIVVYPVILVDLERGVDTIVQISNSSDQIVNALCFYVNANGHCSNTGSVCFSGAQCPGGQCLPGWTETDFRLRVTGRQPLGWVASQGLLEYCSPNQISGEPCIPLNGTSRRGPGNQSNVGTRVPPVSDDRFVGELKCIAIDERGRPSERNVLTGSSTTVQVSEEDCLDVVRHNAIGIRAIAGTNNGDNRLVLGEEYEACPATLILNHYFEGAISPVTGEEILGALVLVPCSEDFLLQNRNATAITAQFLVFNEFEQRFSTSTPVECYASLPLSTIDTSQPTRSIFYVGVAGTFTGQTRIRGVGPGGHGLLGSYFDLHGSHSSAANLHFQGETDTLDIIRIP